MNTWTRTYSIFPESKQVSERSVCELRAPQGAVRMVCIRSGEAERAVAGRGMPWQTCLGYDRRQVPGNEQEGGLEHEAGEGEAGQVLA